MFLFRQIHLILDTERVSVIISTIHSEDIKSYYCVPSTIVLIQVAQNRLA